MSEINKCQLLSPAGSVESLYAAIENGADAVYAGGKRFSARQSAGNFTNEEIKEVSDYCHILGKKLFLTVNTLYKDSELNEILEFVHTNINIGVDAFIVQDIGIAKLLKNNFNGINLHASTQMTAHSINDVKFLQGFGFKRAVLSRELSLKEISEIINNTSLEIECFVHGALCVSYSGQCLMSSIIGGRSGNRGRCAQPCRLEYSLTENNKTMRQGYLLSPKDLNTVTILPELIQSGINTFKIEGRMKSFEYVSGVTRIYRKYIDLYYSGKEYTVDEYDLDLLTKLFNRAGFTKGYYYNFSGSEMMYMDNKELLKSSVDKETSKMLKMSDFSFDKVNISANFIAEKSLPVKLTLKHNDYIVEELGDIPLDAINAPTNTDIVKKQLYKTGNSLFNFDNIECHIENNLFITVSSINNLRRNAINKLEKVITENYYKSEKITETPSFTRQAIHEEKQLSVTVRTAAQLKSASECEYIDRIYIESGLLRLNEVIDITKSISNKQMYIALPRIQRNNTDLSYLSSVKNYCEGYLVRTYGQFYKYKNSEMKIAVDYTLNVFNSYSTKSLQEHNMTTTAVSAELNINEISKIYGGDIELVIYGRLPLMVTHQCPIGIYCAGKNSSKFCKLKNSSRRIALKDRKGMYFPILSDCENCTSFVYNSQKLLLTGRIKEILNTPSKMLRLEFVDESASETDRVLKIHGSIIKNHKIPDTKNLEYGYTKGHFFRGVE